MLAPHPVEGMTWAEATIETAYGTVGSAWRVDDEGALRVDVRLPFGTRGTFVAPVTSASSVRVDGHDGATSVELGPGHHEVVVSEPRLAARLAKREAPGSRLAAI
jgi:alpha-L-rhamnosidase